MKLNKFIPTSLLLTFLLVGCGSSASSSKPASSEKPSSVTPASGSSKKSEDPSKPSSVDPTGAIDIDFWHTFGAKTSSALDKVKDDFVNLVKKEQGVDLNIKLTYQGGYDEINTKVRDGLAAGNVPTITVAYPDHVADYLKAEGTQQGRFVYNLENYFDDSEIGFGKQDFLGELSDTEDFVEAFIDEGTHYVNKGTYSLPFMKSSEVLFYNTQLLVSAYNKVNKTTASEAEVVSWINNVSWEEFIAFSEDCAEIMGDISKTLETILFYDSDSNFIISKMFQEGIKYSSIGEDKKGIIEFENPTEKAKLNDYVTELKRLHENKTLTTKGCENKYGSDYFTNFKCIFTVGSSGGTGYNDPGTAFDPGVCKVPASKENPQYVTQGPTLAFLKATSDSAAADLKMKYAWEFAKYLTSPSVNVYMCIYGSEGYLPVSYPAFQEEKFIEFREEGELFAKSYNVLIDDIQGAYLNTAIFPGSSVLRDQMEGIIKESLTNAKPVATAIDDAIQTAKLAIN